jgi:adenine-specific DNA methylase
VDFLVGWAMRDGASSIMDPSCGDGSFLQAAQDGGAARLIGIDLDPTAVEGCRSTLQGADAALLLQADFFAIDPGRFGGLDAIVGNPPFVRYQRFSETSRRPALESALRFGVRLTRLTSTWAPFLLHAAQFLRTGGRLVMVVPAEISQTQYGLPTLRALVGRFASVTLVSFEQNIFKDAQADTYLLLAEGYGGRADGVQLLPLRGLDDLADMSPDENRGLALPIEEDFRFVEAFLSPAERRAWRRAKAAEQVFALGDLGTITNGYVTGDNEFFHRTRSEAVAGGIPSEWLLPVARNARSFPGLRLALDDLEAQEAGGKAHHLVVPEDGLFSDGQALERFVSEGEGLGTPQRFKCRTRTPWWRVPGLVQADILLTYMAGTWPRAALNTAGAL